MGIQHMQMYMQQLLELARKYHITMTVAVYPWPDQIIHNDVNSFHVQIWKSWCYANNVAFINHFPDFVQGKTRQERKAIIRRHFFSGDAHWNAQGHARIARAFLASYLPTWGQRQEQK
jgi:oligoribonuclease NrnB/cAMP/cGMP phosphodiesterase (DHH superfamily)